MAGTGKSTIARTIARSRIDSADLAATFFFKRGESERRNLRYFMTTLAHQIAACVPNAGALIKAALDDDSTIGGKDVETQFDRLIKQPLLKILESGTTPKRLVLVVDALDECDQDEDIGLLIRILSETHNLRSHLRVFVTSRPELPIRLGFKNISHTYQGLILHEVSDHIVKEDIRIFIDSRCDAIRQNFNNSVEPRRRLEESWPDTHLRIQLTKRAMPLFISAKIICLFMEKSRDPDGQLRKILAHDQDLGSRYIDLYRPLLDAQVSPREKRKFLATFGSWSAQSSLSCIPWISQASSG